MKGYCYIGDGKPHRLIELTISSDVRHDTVISIYDQSDQMIARGQWYEDHILELDKRYGVATGDREHLDFRLV